MIGARALDAAERLGSTFTLLFLDVDGLDAVNAAYGPFVMCTKAELVEAFEDYQAGRLGTIPSNAIQPHRVQ